MSTMEEKPCRSDDDCSSEQYCYHVSHKCVKYPPCARHNRQESHKPSRYPSQCGPCLPGYVDETLSTGQKSEYCKKIIVREETPDVNRLNSDNIIYATAGITIVLSLVVLILFVNKRLSERSKKSTRPQRNDVCAIGPSAPPMEHTPFIGHSDDLLNIPFNNNKNLKDKNKLVCAVPCKEPGWVSVNPNYENGLNDDNMNIMDQSHSIVEIPSTNNNSNSWNMEPVSIEITRISVVQGDEEQIDNRTNSILVQRNTITSSNTADDNSNGNNSDANSSTDSSSDSNNAQHNRERAHSSNVLINQNININMINNL